jgi:pyruvate dehydrogenase E1 component
VDARFITLGTDGFGRSDTRQALRRFFEVDRHHIVLAALDGLVAEGRLEPGVCKEAISRYGIDTGRAAPWLS